jgi:hypothetical protein
MLRSTAETQKNFQFFLLPVTLNFKCEESLGLLPVDLFDTGFPAKFA